MEIKAIHIKNFKGFREDSKEIQNIKNLNIFIGKNNSGKSTILQVLDTIFNIEKINDENTFYKYIKKISNNGNDKPITIDISVKFTDKELASAFPNNTTTGSLRFENLRSALKNEQIKISIDLKESIEKKQLIKKSIVIENQEFFKKIEETYGIVSDTLRHIIDSHSNPLIRQLKNYESVFVPSIRQLAEENENDINDIRFSPNGQNMTATIRNYLHTSDLPTEKIENDLKKYIKQIFFEG